MSNMDSPWASQLVDATDLQNLVQKVTLYPKEKLRLSSLSEFNAPESVRWILNQCYVPGESSKSAIAKIVSVALDGALRRYPSTHEFSLQVNSLRFSAPQAPIFCLTGLAGVGKSAIFDAVQRLIGSLPDIQIPKHGEVEHKPISRVQILDRWGSREMAKHFGLPERGSNIARALYQRGCSLIALDELQFVATSESANTRASKLIYATSLYGPALVFACNFSLGHKLKKRPHEERDRILCSPIVLLPDLAQSVAWKERLRVWSTAIQDLMGFDLAERSEDFWSLVVGINRSAIHQLSVSSALALADRSGIRWEHIERAYKSSEYSVMRRSIESIQAISRGCDQGSLDLICPFESTDGAAYIEVVRNLRRSHFSESAGVAAQTKNVKQKLKKENEAKPDQSATKPRARPLDAATLVKSAADFRAEVRLGRRV